MKLHIAAPKAALTFRIEQRRRNTTVWTRVAVVQARNEADALRKFRPPGGKDEYRAEETIE